MKTLIVSILLVVLYLNPLHGQRGETDSNAWLVAGFEFEAVEDLKIGVEGQLRLKEDISVVDQYFGELNAQYKLPAGFRLGAGLRYIRDNDNQGNIQGYENHLRYNIDGSYRHKIERFSLRYRIRYQNRNELGISKDEGDIHREAIRLRARVIYNVRNWKLDPAVAIEFFNRFRSRNYDNGFNKYRITIGTNYKVKKVGRFALAYLYENEFNINAPRSFHILKLGYTFEL